MVLTVHDNGQARPQNVSMHDHLQLLYGAALEFLDHPFPPVPHAHQAAQQPPEQPAAAAEQQDGAAADHQQKDAELRELLGLGELTDKAELAAQQQQQQQQQTQPKPLPAAQSAAVYIVYALWASQPQPVAGIPGAAAAPQGAPQGAPAGQASPA